MQNNNFIEELQHVVIGVKDDWLEYTEKYIHAKAILQYFDLYKNLQYNIV